MLHIRNTCTLQKQKYLENGSFRTCYLDHRLLRTIVFTSKKSISIHQKGHLHTESEVRKIRVFSFLFPAV